MRWYHAVGIMALAILTSWALVACEGIYTKMGLTPQQATTQADQDRTQTITFLENVRQPFWDILTSVSLGALGLLGGLLGVGLKRANALSGALIAGVEQGGNPATKSAIQTVALAAGVEGSLHAKLAALGLVGRSGGDALARGTPPGDPPATA